MKNLTKNKKLENMTFIPTKESNRYDYYPYPDSDFEPEEGWYRYTELIGFASTYIENKLKEYNQDILWLKTYTTPPEYSFAPLIFQCKNTIFAVKIIEYVNGEVIEEDPCPDVPDFISISIANNFIPCYLPVFTEIAQDSSKISVKSTDRLILLDARTKEEIDVMAMASDEPTLMSEHEQFHIAVKTISTALKQKGFHIESESIIMDRYPNVNCYDKKGRLCMVFVRFTNNLNNLKKMNLEKFLRWVQPGNVYPTYLAPVFIGTQNKKIYRNQPVDISCLEDIMIKLPLSR